MLTLKPMMPKMMIAAKIDVIQFVKATMHASLNDDHNSPFDHDDYLDKCGTVFE